MADEAPSEHRETRREKPLRSALRAEAVEQIRVPEDTDDSDAYEHAATAVEAFLKRTLDAADVIEGELRKNDHLPPDDDRRLKPEELRQYEDFLTQAEALAIIFPRLLQQARIVQYMAEVQRQLHEVFAVINDREDLIRGMEFGRARVLHGSERAGRPFRPDEMRELVPLATLAWMTREKLSLHPQLTDAQKRDVLHTVRNLSEAETLYREKTEEAGGVFRETGKEADERRRSAGAERITEGLPGAELILDTPEISIVVWERLLIDGGPNEKVRAARQLREGVLQFQNDFMKLRAYEEFEGEAQRALQEHIRKNESIGFWFDLLDIPGLQTLKGKVLTKPEEFRKIFDEVTAKVKGRFGEIASSDDAGRSEELVLLLEQMEKGKEGDVGPLRNLLHSYARLQRHTGALLAALQRWQIAENVGRVGGMRDPNMLDQITRIGGKTIWSHFGDFAPYGVFRPRSYRQEDGRLILLAPAEAETLGYQLKEGTKAYFAMEGVILMPLLHRLTMRIPLLGKRLFGHWSLRFGIPAALAEASMAGARGGAETLQMRQAIDAVEQSIEHLEKSPGALPQRVVRDESKRIFEHLLIALHAAGGKDPHAPDQELALEAHLYTNELLMAMGYPPYHEIAPEVIPSLPTPEMSPELTQYLAVKQKAREGVNVETRADLAKLQATLGGRRTPELSPADELLSTGKIPVTSSKEGLLHTLVEAVRVPEFREKRYKREIEKLGSSEAERRLAVFRTAGDVSLALEKLRRIDRTFRHRFGWEFRGRENVPFAEKVRMGPHEFSLAEVENDVHRLVNDMTPLRLLTIARSLEMREPSNGEIARYWYRETYPPGRIARLFGAKRHVDNEIARRFGAPKNRAGLGEKFLREWVDLWDYARHFVPEGGEK